MVRPYKETEYVETLPREFGRAVYEPRTGAERVALLRQIIASSEPARVDSEMVTTAWARMLVDLHDDLGPAERAKLAEAPISKAREVIVELATRRVAG